MIFIFSIKKFEIYYLIIYVAHLNYVVVYLLLILFFSNMYKLILSQLFALAAFDASSFRLWMVISSIIVLHRNMPVFFCLFWQKFVIHGLDNFFSVHGQYC